MEDQSALDNKYFIDKEVYNCPFCKRNNVVYAIVDSFDFRWSVGKVCYGYIARCSSCGQTSLHLSYSNILNTNTAISFMNNRAWRFKAIADIDSAIFYSQPTSFFVVDSRIPGILRDLITESEGCLKMNYLTGASACTRKAIYELLVLKEAEGPDYESRIKSLKKLNPASDPMLFDILCHIQDMTSDKIHEQSWDKWDSPNLKLIIEALKNVLFDIYVLPENKKQRSLQIERLRETLIKDKTTGAEESR